MIKYNKTEKDKLGWLKLAEKSLIKIWDNEKDDKVWIKYLDESL